MHGHCTVLTGDVVGSRRLDAAGRTCLAEALQGIAERLPPVPPLPAFDRYRGDAFQMLLADPAEALATALRIRATLRTIELPSGKLDARLGIGCGPVEFPGRSLAESDGTAFRRSGTALDELSEPDRLSIATDDPDLDADWNATFRLLDAVVERWTPAQAEAIVRRLDGRSQTEIAEGLGVTQAAIQQRLKAASWDAVHGLARRWRARNTPKTPRA